MIELAPRNSSIVSVTRIGVPPIAIGAVALILLVLGIGSITLWRAYTGNAPETDRGAATRQLQARTPQASEQLVEKTKGRGAPHASQKTDTKKLSEQVGALTEAINGLRESFASTQATEPAAEPTRKRSANAKPHAIRSAHRQRGKSQG